MIFPKSHRLNGIDRQEVAERIAGVFRFAASYHAFRLYVSLVGWLLFNAAPSLAQPSAVPGRVTVPTSSAAENALALILEDWRAGRFETVTKNLHKFRKEHEKALVSVTADHVLCGRLVFDLLALQLPFEARRGFGVETEEDSLLKRLADPRQAPQLLKVADQHWQRGEIEAARQIWLMLAAPNQGLELRLPRWQVVAPDAKLSGDALARLVLAGVTCDQLDAARQRLQELQQRFPLRKGRLAGRSGPWEETLRQLISEADHWPREQFDNQSGTPWLPGEDVRLDFIQQLWSVGVETEGSSSDVLRIPNSSSAAALVADRVVLINDAAGIRSLNLETGHSAWPYDDVEAGFLLPPQAPAPSDGNTSHVSRTRPGLVTENEWLGCVNQRLVKLNLAAEGRLEWSRTADELSNSTSRSRLVSGPALVTIPNEPARIVVSLQSAAPNSSSQLVCVDFEGQVLWRSIRVGWLSATADSSLEFPEQLQADSQSLFWSLDAGTVLAIDPRTGSIRWLRRRPTEQSVRSVNETTDLSVESESLFAVGGRSVMSLEPTSGAIRWQCTCPTLLREVIGVSDNSLVVSGDELWGIDRTSGRILWRVGVRQPPSQGNGRGLLLGRSVFWPTRSELWTVDAVTGRIRQRDALQQLTGAGPGNLTLRGDVLLSTTASQLTAYRMDVRQHFPQSLPQKLETSP